MATSPYQARTYRLRVAYLSGDEIFAVTSQQIDSVAGCTIDEVARAAAEAHAFHNLRVPDLRYRITIEPFDLDDPDDPGDSSSGLLRPVCSRCGSDLLIRDATAQWDVDRQDWLLAEILPSTTCTLCGAESDHLSNWQPASDVTATDRYLADVANLLNTPHLLENARFAPFCLSTFLELSVAEAAQAWRRTTGGHDEP